MNLSFRKTASVLLIAAMGFISASSFSPKRADASAGIFSGDPIPFYAGIVLGGAGLITGVGTYIYSETHSDNDELGASGFLIGLAGTVAGVLLLDDHGAPQFGTLPAEAKTLPGMTEVRWRSYNKQIRKIQLASQCVHAAAISNDEAKKAKATNEDGRDFWILCGKELKIKPDALDAVSLWANYVKGQVK